MKQEKKLLQTKFTFYRHRLEYDYTRNAKYRLHYRLILFYRRPLCHFTIASKSEKER